MLKCTVIGILGSESLESVPDPLIPLFGKSVVSQCIGDCQTFCPFGRFSPPSGETFCPSPDGTEGMEVQMGEGLRPGCWTFFLITSNFVDHLTILETF